MAYASQKSAHRWLDSGPASARSLRAFPQLLSILGRRINLKGKQGALGRLKLRGALSFGLAFLMLSSAAFPVFATSVPPYVSYNSGAASKYHAPISGMGLLALSHAFAGVTAGQSQGASGSVPPPQGIPTGLDLFINDSSYAPQSETTVAADPSNPNHVVGGYNDAKWFFCPSLMASECPNGYTESVTGFSVSTDRGATVAKSNDLPGILATEKNLSSGASAQGFLLSWGDPSVLPATDGTFYFASLAIDPITGANGILLEKSNSNLFDPTFSCSTPLTSPSTNPCWTAHMVFANLSYQCFGAGLCGTSSFEDKDTIAVDTDPTSPTYGYVYVAWDHFFATGTSASYLAVCAPSLSCTMLSGGGAPPLSGGDPFAGNATPAVAGDGTVYLSWCNFGTYFTYGPVYCSIRSSSAGGTSFGPFHQVMSFMGAGTQLSGDTVIVGFATEQFRTASELTLVAGSGPDVYFAIPLCTSGFYYRFNDDPALPADNPGNCGGSAIFFTRSTNGGVNWSSPDQVSSQAVSIQPTLAFDSTTGVVVLAYYTSQYDPFNHRIDVVVAVSGDQGQSFSLTRVTPVSNEPDSDPSQYNYITPGGFGGSLVVPQFGDYFTAWAHVGEVWVLFTGNYAKVQGAYKASPFLATVGEAPLSLNLSSNSKDASPGDTVSFSAGGFSAGSTVKLTLNWDGLTISLANATVSQSGVATGNFTVPNVASQVYPVVATDGRGFSASASLGVGQVSLTGVQSTLASLQGSITTLQNMVTSLGSSLNSGLASLNSTIDSARGSLASSVSAIGSSVSGTTSTLSLVEYLAILILVLVVVVLAVSVRKGRPPSQAPSQPSSPPGSA